MLRTTTLAALAALALGAGSASASTLGTTALLSVSSGTSGGDERPLGLDSSVAGEAISADGRYVAFVDLASNLTSTPDANSTYDVFWRDTQTGQTKLVSVNSAGTAAGNSASDTDYISDDGRWVVFRSDASDLVAGYTGSTHEQIYARDTQTNTTYLVSHATAGDNVGGNGDNVYPIISGNGRYVVWSCKSTNTETPDIVGGASQLSGFQICIHDLQGDTTSFVTVSPDGQHIANAGFNDFYAITPDGRYVAFQSEADNLVTGYTNPHNGADEVYRRDMQTATTVLASPATDGPTVGADYSNGFSNFDISDDGRYITFDAQADDMVAGFVDNNCGGCSDVYQRDVTAGTTTLISGTSATSSGNDGSMRPQASSDGRYVMFYSDASNLVPGDTNGNPDLIRWDRTTGAKVAVTAATGSSTPAGGGSGVEFNAAQLSADGNYAAFADDAPGMLNGLSGSGYNVYFRDIAAGTTQLVSAIPGSSTAAGNQLSHNAWMSRDATAITWTSAATDLIASFGNLNGAFEDVFVRPTGVSPPSTDTGGTGGGGGGTPDTGGTTTTPNSTDSAPPASTPAPTSTSSPLGTEPAPTPPRRSVRKKCRRGYHHKGRKCVKNKPRKHKKHRH